MIIYLDDRRLQAADLVSKIQHVSGGIPLLTIGLQKISIGESDWPIAVVEVILASVVLVLFLRDVRAFRRREAAHTKSHAAFGWFDMAVGALLMFEAFHGHHVKPGYLRPPFFAGVVTIGLGLFHGRFRAFQRRRRYVKFDPTGLEGRLGPFRRFSFAWTDLKSVETGQEQAVLIAKGGKRRTISLSRLNNGDAVRQAISDHARAAGLLAAD